MYPGCKSHSMIDWITAIWEYIQNVYSDEEELKTINGIVFTTDEAFKYI